MPDEGSGAPVPRDPANPLAVPLPTFAWAGGAGEIDPERQRLLEQREGLAAWHRWGPYLACRAWGTVREDYSADGTAWTYFPHDHARSRAYRWNEDGLLGISDVTGHLCFALALWNEADPILKERPFGLNGLEGNHGEDLKELYYYLDNTPTHSYMRALYKYPQRAFPYAELLAENARRGRAEPEYELVDTGAFADNRYFDVFVEYAKADPDDIVIRITVVNRGPDPAPLHLLPTLWFRNSWSWGRGDPKPYLYLGASAAAPPAGMRLVEAISADVGEWRLHCEGEPTLLFTENNTNYQRLFNAANPAPFVKDGINDYLIHGATSAVNPAGEGTKLAAHYALRLGPGEQRVIRLRLANRPIEDPFTLADTLIETRRAEADRFYAPFGSPDMAADARLVLRQAFAGLLWCKQFYHYDVRAWLAGDPGQPPPPPERLRGRNADWQHLNSHDVIAMPDSWEYPWFAAWDLAFHCIPLALLDPEFAKQQLILLGREWYQHPNGQLPAYEWAFGDVNPPVHAWAALRVYETERRLTGRADRSFLERVFHKQLLNFTWWVNRKDPEGRNVFEGGFLGLDNIGVFDRSAQLPGGGYLEQSDGTAWMGMYSLTMLRMAIELAMHNRVYEDVATKFFEHFLYIAGALNDIAGEGVSMWDEEDSFFYDVLRRPGGEAQRIKVRSWVGLIPLLAVETIEPEVLDRLPEFRLRLEWFLQNRPHLSSLVSRWYEPGKGERRLLALVRGHRMKCLLRRALDPAEFLSDYGLRSVSRYHLDHPYTLTVDGHAYTVTYEPAESRTGLFGGNSNWRGPVWFPLNYLVIEALLSFHYYYGDDFLVEAPTGSGQKRTLAEIADDLSRRLIRIFLRDESGRRPVFGTYELLQRDPQFRDYILFHEYFHGDTGVGLGASHQTGWTALVAKLLERTEREAIRRERAEPQARRRASAPSRATAE